MGSGSLLWAQMNPTYDNHDTYSGWPERDFFDGIVFMRSEVKMRQVTDGTSATYMVGEKNVRPQAYEGGNSGAEVDFGDDEGYLIGHNGDCVRSSGYPPFPDHPNAHLYQNWGSAHPAGFHMMFADGSVRMINFDIDLDTHRALGTRAGGEVVDESD